MNIEKHLERWVGAELITSDQADKIKAFEKKTPSAGWALWGISGVGIVVLMTGVISLIAAHWGDISPTVKLAVYFLVFLLLSLITIKKGKNEGLIKEVLLTFLSLYALGGVGLIGQVYNLVSDGYTGLFFWLLIIFPITLLAKSKLIQYIWFIGFTTAALIWGFETGSLDSAERNAMILISIPYFWIAIGYVLDRKANSYFFSAARVWNWLIVMLGYTLVGSFIWNQGSKNFQQEHITQWQMLPVLSIAAVIGGILSRKVSPGLVSTFALLAMIIGSGLLFIYPAIFIIEPHQIIPCILFFVTWGGFATLAALTDRKRMYDIAAFIIGARFVVVYFEVFGTLAATGIGLIISGGMILGVAYAWYKYRATLAALLKGAA